ncbi:hypothetical protein KUTeg_012542 [Tegillarca granosa]|uniref:Secreted protein n=1 Tax=Tegillarca granosa TaxID=220873 RepID=A0ABQ9F473_TEGGR|nr:hypothetical protein KUTeg_012542 [Tegillarca granosa]
MLSKSVLRQLKFRTEATIFTWIIILQILSFLSLWNNYGTSACGTRRYTIPPERTICSCGLKGQKVLSTIHSHSETIVQRSSHNRETGQFDQQDIACPIAVAQYT